MFKAGLLKDEAPHSTQPLSLASYSSYKVPNIQLSLPTLMTLQTHQGLFWQKQLKRFKSYNYRSVSICLTSAGVSLQVSGPELEPQ